MDVTNRRTYCTSHQQCADLIAYCPPLTHRRTRSPLSNVINQELLVLSHTDSPTSACLTKWQVSALINDCAPRPYHKCFTPPMTFPLTCAQSMLASSSSSISPHTATFSPLIRYSPWGTSVLGSGSSCGRITRSIVWLRTRFVSWSQDSKVPVKDRPSAVRTSTFSAIWYKHSVSHYIS